MSPGRLPAGAVGRRVFCAVSCEMCGPRCSPNAQLPGRISQLGLPVRAELVDTRAECCLVDDDEFTTVNRDFPYGSSMLLQSGDLGHLLTP